jgi:nitroreductase
MAAITLALEGIGGRFRLADFDRLSLSNLNRLRGGVHEIGVRKTTLAARELAEIDPYLEVELFEEGVHDGNVDAFLDGLDVLVEECDDLYLKVAIRERARARKIPVVMDTSDRGLLDVERFDREPGRPIFHGLLGEVAPEHLRDLPTKEKVPFLLSILDASRLSDRAAASLPEIQQTIGSWPQLASSVALGGAITTDVVRRILLGTFGDSGRYYVDPESIVRDGEGLHRAPIERSPPPPPLAESRAPVTLPEAPPEGAIDARTGRFLAACACLAPSAHNTQPWSFVFAPGGPDRPEARLEAIHDRSRDLAALDWGSTATDVTFGAIVENVELAAAAIGLSAATTLFPDPKEPHRIASIALAPSPGSAPVDPLWPFVTQRITNRRRDGRVRLERAQVDALVAAAQARDADLELVEDDAALAELGEILGEGDRITILDRALHRDFFSGFRWTPDEVARTRDGLDLDALEITPAERAGLEVLRPWRVVSTLGAIGGGRALGDMARASVASSSAIGLVTVRGVARTDYVRGGRASQRIWLEATRRGLAIHPWTGLLHLFARLERGGGEGFDPRQRAELFTLRRRWAHLFRGGEGRGEAFLFRIAVAGPPTARALRRRLDDVLRIV